MSTGWDDLFFEEKFPSIAQWLENAERAHSVRTKTVLHETRHFAFGQSRIHRDHERDHKNKGHQYYFLNDKRQFHISYLLFSSQHILNPTPPQLLSPLR